MTSQRSPAVPMPPERPPPVDAQRGALTPPPLPSFARLRTREIQRLRTLRLLLKGLPNHRESRGRCVHVRRDESSPRGDDQLVKIEEPENRCCIECTGRVWDALLSCSRIAANISDE